MAVSICKICNESHDYQSGFFTRHLLSVHDMTLEDYIIKTEYDGVQPKCACGLCESRPEFVRGRFHTHAKGHKSFDFNKRMYLEKYGQPKCPTCGDDITKWHRGLPRKYCNIKCRPGTWNQDKIKNTVKDKYGVNNVFKLEHVKSIIDSKVDRADNSRKATATKKLRYDNGAFDVVKHQSTMLEKYGVTHPSKISKNRESSSKRMIDFNKIWHYKISKYKDTELYYQSSYELHFLDLCESMNILDRISNGNSYEYVGGNHRTLTDFCIDGCAEIEIKSSYIMKRQGGMLVLNEKRRAVESIGKQYIIILDKDYSQFLHYIRN